MTGIIKRILLPAALLLAAISSLAQGKSLHELQQEFVDLRFGMFVHFGLPTYQDADWTDPDLDPKVFNPVKLDTRQWVETARSAGATFICVSVKHHAGFCMWDTATTDYSVMHTPLGRDVLRELTDALQEAGMQVMFHFSILDTHHRIRPTLPFTPEKTEFIKAQLRELLTLYGPVNTIMFDGWDAPWGRISYEDVSFPEIYHFIKSIQPNCLVMDLNGAKYPQEALFYSDIRCYEQGAGQKISPEVNRLPAMACYPLQRTWFWKDSFPTDTLKDVEAIVRDNLIPYNEAYCTYILNAAPNRDGLIDPNAVAAFRRIGELWKNTGHIADVPVSMEPITDINIAAGRPCDSSWSDDMNLMDFANDDNFHTAWVSSPQVKEPWWKVDLDGATPIDMVVITEAEGSAMAGYRVETLLNGVWTEVARSGGESGRVHICRFPAAMAESVRIRFSPGEGSLAIAEVCVSQRYAPPVEEIPISADEEVSATTLIVIVDNGIGKEPLRRAVRKYGAKIIYDYKIVPGMAIKIPEGDDILKAMAYFEKVEGVVSVQRDKITRLTDPVPVKEMYLTRPIKENSPISRELDSSGAPDKGVRRSFL